MKEIEEVELREMNGGISAWGALGIGALAAFLVGIFDGIARPLKCNK